MILRLLAILILSFNNNLIHGQILNKPWSYAKTIKPYINSIKPPFIPLNPKNKPTVDDIPATPRTEKPPITTITKNGRKVKLVRRKRPQQTVNQLFHKFFNKSFTKPPDNFIGPKYIPGKE